MALAARRAEREASDDLFCALPRLHADARGWSLAGVPDSDLRAAEAFEGYPEAAGAVSGAPAVELGKKLGGEFDGTSRSYPSPDRARPRESLDLAAVDSMTVVALKAALAERGLKRTGLKADLRKRLLDDLGFV